MTFEKRVVIVEIAGLAAVTASLAFVGLQMMQTQDIARATMRLELTTASQELIFKFADYPEAWMIASGMREPAREEERQRARMLFRAGFRGFENYAYQYRNGFFDETEWEGFKGGIASAMSTPFNRELWRDISNEFSPAFREVVDALIRRD
jgi:hypothetical protein